MPAARISMRQIIEVLRLKYEAGLSHERIARACGLSKGVIGKYVSLATAQGITWPLPEGTNEARLEAQLFPAKTLPSRFAEPDYFQVHQELKTKGVTLQLLWAEYVERHGDKALRYSQFCHHYRLWRVQLHLRRGHLVPVPAGLDRLSPADAGVLWWRAGTAGSGQPQGSGHQGRPIHAPDHRDLRGAGRPLPDGGVASTTLQAQGQGKSGSRCVAG